ncbi:MAG: DUF433 domain-containing protein [Planctomycetes bacterium]|nr:DUF433 domain-containing protein [Planctomycetota bacterium]
MVTLNHSPVRSDPAVMGGSLVFRATRVPAQSLLDYLDDGYSLDEFLEMFPSVDREDAVAFLNLVRGEAVPGPLSESRDEWEQRLRGVATDCGVSLPDNAVGREGIYE